MGSDVLR